jgi:hypothetical protein
MWSLRCEGSNFRQLGYLRRLRALKQLIVAEGQVPAPALARFSRRRSDVHVIEM